MGLELTKLNGCRLGDLATNKDQCKQSVHIKGERILNYTSDITGLYFSLSLRIYECNVCFMCSMCVHLRTFYTYMTNQQSHICKCAQLHIISFTNMFPPLTWPLLFSNMFRSLTWTLLFISMLLPLTWPFQQHVSDTHVTITLQQHVSVTHMTITLHSTRFCHSRDHYSNMFRTLTWPLVFSSMFRPLTWPLIYSKIFRLLTWPLLFINMFRPLLWPLLFSNKFRPLTWPILFTNMFPSLLWPKNNMWLNIFKNVHLLVYRVSIEQRLSFIKLTHMMDISHHLVFVEKHISES